MLLRTLEYTLAVAAMTILLSPSRVTAGDPLSDKPTEKVIRAGIIGLDTSHVKAFTELLNAPAPKPGVAGVRVVAAFPGGSPDIPSSRDRVAGFTKELREKHGVAIVDSIDQLLDRVDVVLLESVDGRPHLEQARPVFRAKKPVFIDKPVAGSLADTLTIYELARASGTPVFCSSSLRFGPSTQSLRNNPKIGDILGCDTHGPCELEPHHPDLFWYGVHGVELLYTVMGTGCRTVTRTHTDETDFVVGTWKDGRIGTYRGVRQGPYDFGALVFGSKTIGTGGKYSGYEDLVVEIVKFFQTKQPPVSADETIEIMTFMEAADESKRQGGKPVSLEATLAKARSQSAP